MQYDWKEGSRQKKGGAQEVGDRLDKIKAANKSWGAREIVADASDELSPLHSYFEWNDTEAAKEHRLMQARRLVSWIVVQDEIDPDEPSYIRAFVFSGDSYHHIDEVNSDAVLRADVLLRCHRELKSIRRKYAELITYLDVWEAIDSIAEESRAAV